MTQFYRKRAVRMKFFLQICFVVFFGEMAVADPSFWKYEWPRTDFSKRHVESWTEILSGGPGKDGIPAVSAPKFIPINEAALDAEEPVIAFEIEGFTPRAYPLRYLMWHEIVNDRYGDRGITVTFCPLCNSSIVFDGDGLTFGVTGKLRHSDMVMYDHQTESWWQQAVGLGIVGEKTGARLTIIPSWVESVAQFKKSTPKGVIMAEPDFPRPYGQNPYAGYDSAARPFLYSGAPPPHGIAPLARVVRVGNKAWPLERLRAKQRIVSGDVVLLWQEGMASALDTRDIASGRDIGMIRVQDRAGRNLVHDVMFAFAFDAFYPNGTWMIGP